MTAIDKISQFNPKAFGSLTAAPVSPRISGPTFGASQPLEKEAGLIFPGKSPSGHISPAITSDKVGRSLPSLYA